MVIEINGMRAFFPYTRKMAQYGRFKAMMLKGTFGDNAPENQERYKLLDLNVHSFEGLLLEPSKLESLLGRVYG